MCDKATKSIDELKSFHFYVEDYQRGYKWTEVEVNQLLDDINEFNCILPPCGPTVPAMETHLLSEQ